VVIVAVVVAALELGVTVEGLNEQFAIAGNPVQAKVIGLANEPCGVAVKVNVPDCPAGTDILAGLEAKVKSDVLTWKLWLTGVAAAKVALPACVAWMVHVPTAIIVTVAADTVQTAGVVEAKLTARPEDAVALSVNGALPSA
jgi:hypothetical protein